MARRSKEDGKHLSLFFSFSRAFSGLSLSLSSCFFGLELPLSCCLFISAYNLPPLSPSLKVGTEGVKCIESLTHEILLAFVLKDISFTTVSGKHKELFAFIQKDDSLGMINCHVFQ